MKLAERQKGPGFPGFFASAAHESAHALARAAHGDMPGCCKIRYLDNIRKHGHVLTPAYYVGAERKRKGGKPFEEDGASRRAA